MPCVRSCLANSKEHATEPALEVQAAHRSSFSNPLQLQQLRVEDGKAIAGVGAWLLGRPHAALRAVCGAVAAPPRAAALPLLVSVVAGLWAPLATLRLALRQQDVAGPSKVRSRAVCRGVMRSTSSNCSIELAAVTTVAAVCVGEAATLRRTMPTCGRTCTGTFRAKARARARLRGRGSARGEGVQVGPRLAGWAGMGGGRWGEEEAWVRVRGEAQGECGGWG